MKTFLLITASFFVLAILLAIVVYVYVSLQLQTIDDSVLVIESAVLPDNPETIDSQAESVDPAIVSPAQQETASDVPTEGIPLSTIPLGDGQKSILSAVGIDVETYVISPDTLACAQDTLGLVRSAEIVAGDTPTLGETTRLLPCLR